MSCFTSCSGCFMFFLFVNSINGQDLPVIMPFSFPRNLKLGNRVSVTCSVTSGQQPLTFIWRKDNNEIMETQNIRLLTNKDVSVITIDSVNERNMGNYTCFVKNKFGSTYHTVTLEVPVAPFWQIEPTDSEAVIGQNITLDCQANGFPAPTISWNKLGNPFGKSENLINMHQKTAENGTLILSLVKKEDEGYYECTANNGVGSFIKKAINLVIKDIPKIRPFSFPQDLKMGDRVSIICSVSSGTRPLQFQWKKDSSIVTENSNLKIHIHTDLSVLAVDSVTEKNAGNYTCVVSNVAGSTSHSSMLIVPVSPQWKIEPKDTESVSGGNITIQCQAFGFPVPNIKWVRKENPFDPPDVTIDLLKTHYEVTPNGSLIITNIQKEDEGVLECSAKNGIGTELKKVITVTVKETPKITSFNFPENLKLGDRVSIICSVTSGERPLKFQWKKNNQIITENDKILIDSLPAHSVLAIDPITSDSSGNYSCTASNNFGATTYTAVLEVPLSPIWKEEPQSTESVIGSNVTIDCQAYGFPIPKIKWIRKENPFDSPTLSNVKEHYQITSDGSLIIINIQKKDEGVLECSAKNGIGPELKKAISIIVKESPKISPFNFPTNLKIGDRSSIVCAVASGKKPLRFQWLKNNQSLKEDEHITIFTQTVESVLRIEPITIQSSGNYTCSVSNDIGTAQHTAVLEIPVPPTWQNEPKNAEVVSGNNLTILCKTYGFPKPNLVWTRKENPFGMEEDFGQDWKGSSKDGKLILINAKKKDEGTYECSSSNGIGSPLKKMISVIVRESPNINSFNFPLNLKTGDRVSIICDVRSGSKPLHFQWLKNNQSIKQDEHITVNTHTVESVLRIDPITTQSSGNYTCVVSNNVGVAQHTAVLEIPVPPTWKIEPKNTEAVSGSNITIHCKSYGFPTPNLLWTRKENPFGVEEKSTIQWKEKTRDGNLVLTNVNKEDEGTYECSSSNGIGPTLKKIISIVVRELPIINPFNFRKNLKTGDRVSVICAVISGLEPFNFQWVKNNQSLKEDKHITINTLTVESVLRIDPITTQSSGNYTCIVRNNVGVAKHTAVLEIPVPPTWQIEPKNTEAIIGNNVTIQCKSHGFPMPNVLWTRKENPFGVEENFGVRGKEKTKEGNFTLINVKKEDEGTYECSSSNGIGTPLKKIINIIVRDTPKIAPFSFPPNLKIGDTGSLTCSITSGSRPLKFYWKKDQNDIEENKNVRVLTDSDLSVVSIKSITVKNIGNYTCIVSNSFGSNSYTTRLEVPIPPTWRIEPKDVETVKGNNITIECEADGFPEPTVEWLRTENPFANNQEANTFKSSKNGKLKFYSIAKEEEGMYECVAKNNLGATLQKMITIVVKELPVITPFSFPETVKLGDRVSATCTASSGHQPFSFLWKKDDRELVENSIAKIHTINHVSLLTIDPVTPGSAGNYTCSVSNSAGMSHYTATLTVPIPPTWKKEPKNVEAVVGTNLTIECLAYGFPVPSVVWKMKEDNFGNQYNTNLPPLKVHHGELILSEVGKSDGGAYECIASNKLGEIRKIINILVKGEPIIKPFTFPDNLKTGDSLSITCSVISGDKPLSFTWLKDNQEIKNDPNIKIFTHTTISVLTIDPLDTQKRGNYTCLVSNSAGTASHTANLEVPVPPVWVEEPQNTEIVSGENITIQCQAYGFPKPIVHWTKKENPFSSTLGQMNRTFTNGKLVIFKVTRNDEGLYECTASNGIGTSLKKTITLTIKGLPVIQPFHFPDEIEIGSKTSVACLVSSGEKPLTFIWLKDNQNVETISGINIKSDEEFSVLTIDPVNFNSIGNYTCLVTNKMGKDKYTVNLKVKVPPRWSNDLNDIDVVRGKDLNIQCKAEGIPSPIVSWKRFSDSGPLPLDKFITSKNGTFYIENVDIEHSGSYVCEAENGIAPSIRRIITITVHDTPVIQPFSFPQNIIAGKSISVICTATDGIKPLAFSWLKNSKVLSSTENIKITDHDDFSVLTISQVDLMHVGNYTCRVRNKIGSDSHTSILDIKVAPRWTTEPTDQTIIVGSKSFLHCQAFGLPTPQVTWLKIGDDASEDFPVTPTNNDRWSLNKNGTITIENVKTEDRGNYLCQADNKIGQSLKKIIKLSVFVPARFEEKYSTVTTKKGDSASMRCDAVGDQPLSILWKKDSLQLSKVRNSRYEIFETLTSEGLQSELVIRETKRDDGSIYICVAENGYGSDERKVKLSILEVPGRPQNVKITDRWSRSANVAWSVPYTGNSPITQYIVQYWREKGAPHRLHELVVSSVQISAMLDKLHPGTSYMVNVVAENSVGRGEPAKSVRFHTGEEEPSVPPVDVSVEPKGPTTIRVTWKPPPSDSWNGQLKGYYVGYKIRSSGPAVQSYTYRSIEYGGERAQDYLLNNLIKGTEYCVVVQAFNAAGSGPPCHEVVVRTSDGDIPPSPFVSLTSVTTSSITIEWTMKTSKTPVTGYTVHYRKGYNSWKDSSLILASEKQHTITSLESGTFYQLYLTASNQVGKSDPSKVMRVRTDFVEGYKLSSVIDKEWNPPYFQISVLIPVAACVTSIFVAIVVACVCVRKLKHDRRKRGLMEEKQSNYGGTIQRYVDVDKNRPLVNNECSMSSLYPAPYATIPMRDDADGDFAKEGLNHEMKTFVQQNPVNRAVPVPPPRPSSLKKKVDLHLYDSPQ